MNIRDSFRWMFSDEDRLDPIEEAYLHAYPNPNRVGCPGKEVLRALARKALPISHSARDHISQCSPCFREFREFERQLSFRKWSLSIAAVAACVLAIILYFRLKPAGPEHQQEMAVKTPRQKLNSRLVGILNFGNGSVQRGIESTDKEQQLPNASGELIIVLPTGSETGDYSVEIRRAARIDESIAAYGGKVSTEADGRTKLRTVVDFTSFSRGPYVVAWRRRGATSWDYGAFVIR